MTTISLQDGILRAVRRAEIPGLLFAGDVELHLAIPAPQARVAIQDGRLGPWFTVRGEPAVLRDTLREHVRLLAAQIRHEDRELLGFNDLPDAGEGKEERNGQG